MFTFSRYPLPILNIAQVRNIAEEAVRENLGTGLIEDVYAEPGLDWTGNEVLDVMVVIPKGTMGKLVTGNELVAAQRALSDRLLDRGETRFPHITYVSRTGYRRKLRAKARF